MLLLLVHAKDMYELAMRPVIEALLYNKHKDVGAA
jgi:hypothetical protein